ncbi:MAG: metallopeptidase family protein [Acidibrevibacterium sp.]|jgi:acetylglutamate kinase|uniref:metallopeptidase family protein n=1 Tax=Acidibrevibacterium fodinaquatile TaxID=1969806 RepID=UPI0023A87C23|nr:metallopeptidase family protein [Acidibrevibacterium fodinaquatile]MCA7119451.1 metallopeptidase family protein [Acidibrevibacterium fodinaquatile]
MSRAPLLLPPDETVIVAFAEQALAAIPPRLARHLQGVAIMVEDMPDEETLREMELEAGWDLTGLYRGTPLGQKSVDDLARQPDTILLYRLPILLEWIETEVDLESLVRNVVVHEIAHHFGFSDAEIAALEAEIEGRE